MASPPSQPRRRALLLCEDPVASDLLRSLLGALPRPTPEPVCPPAGAPDLEAIASDCSVCFIALGFAGVPGGALLRRLRAAAPALRIFGLLGEGNRHGDRAELLDLLEAGAEEVLRIEDLSPGLLAALLGGQRRGSARGAARSDVAAVAPGAARASGIAGSWSIALTQQRAAFDAMALRALGYGAGSPGEGIAEWKSLVHPADIDALVTAIQAALDEAPHLAPDYRLRCSDGSWASVVSTGIVVERDAAGAPHAVEGRFRARAAATPALPEAPAAPTAFSLAQHCRTALLRYRRDADGCFRVAAGNPAAAAVLGCEPAALEGLPADQGREHYDGYELCEALERVYRSGIGEARDVLVLDRADPPTWRRLQLERIDANEVLVEIADISELVHARALRRIEDELSQFIVRSLPLTVLLVDEAGRVLRCASTAGNVFGSDRGALEDHGVVELFGEAGQDCLAQITRTLNTGRIGIATYAIDAERSHWLECRTTLLRARPGMPPRVLLGVLDASQREHAVHESRIALEQLRAAIASVPVALYLKDGEGRYIASNAAFDQLMGVDGAMLLGKTDVEVFADDLATELHEAAQRVTFAGTALIERRPAGAGAARTVLACLDFPLHSGDGTLLGHGGLWIDPAALPAEPAADTTRVVLDLEAHRALRAADLDHATASVINRVEDALTDSGDYAGVLRQLEQLVETTMQAQALIHHAAGQGGAGRPLVALGPLAREIVDLERILVPASARFENEIDSELPPAHCEPVAFHQILLRGIRHARRSLGVRGSLCIRLRRSQGGRRACIACREGFEGAFVELVIEDSDTQLADEDIACLVAGPGAIVPTGGALDDLAEIHALCHAQGGHLQVHRNVPSGLSVHVFFRAGEPSEAGDAQGARRSTIARFPLGRTQGRGSGGPA